MGYAAVADLIAEFGSSEIIELTDRADPRTYAVDATVAQNALDRADAEIDAALALRYALPLASVPKLLRYIACDLARYYLYDRAEPPTAVKDRWDAARATLAALAAGRAKLGPDVAGIPVNPAPSDLAQIDSGSKIFGRSNYW